jgi:aspartyl-tRNA synthetase
MDTMTGLQRTAYCGTFRSNDIGREVTVGGWVQRQRDLGSLIFVDPFTFETVGAGMIL